MTQQADQPAVSGHIVNARTGRPPARLLVLAARLSSLQAADPEGAAPAEAYAASGMDGRFRIELPAGAEGLDAVVVYPGSPLYTCTAGGAPCGAGWPKAGALLACGPVAVDARAGQDVELTVEPARAVEPYTEMAPMADGTRLATEVFLPDAGGGPWPVALARTPYGRFWQHDIALMLMDRGYAVAMQDMRGRFDSEGEGWPFADCGWAGHRDGLATMEWLLAQPWCDGRIGTFGGSALGITQYLLAAAAPPGLLGQVVAVGAPSLYHYAVYRAGAFAKADTEEWLRQNQWPEDALGAMRWHSTYDAFWRDFDASTDERVARVEAPGLHIGGWYDIFQQGTIDAFVARQHRGGAGARGRQRLLMGPWTHGIGVRQAGEVTWPENAAADVWAASADFLDAAVKGEGAGLAEGPAVRYYLMGAVGEEGAPGCEWRGAADWPPPAESRALHLAQGMALADRPSEAETTFTLVHDPFDPVPSHGGFNLVLPAGPMDQRPVEARSDVLVFTSPPLAEPLEVVGPVRARINVSCDCPDADLVAKLCDVYPDGRSMLVTYGALRLRFRDGFEREETLEPGRVYEVEVDLWSTAYVFNRGHRVRVDVQASDFPRYDANPCTGEPVGQHTHQLSAILRIHGGASRPSRIILPVAAE